MATADLLEAEGRVLRQNTARLGWGLGLTALAVLLAAVGLALCLWALFQFLSQALGTPGAALLTGGLALAVAGVLAWGARGLTR